MKYVLCAVCAVMLFAAPRSLSAQSPDAAARDAVRRLEEALAGKTSGGAPAPAPAPAAASRGGAEPAWVADPYRAYGRDQYIAAVGFAADRAGAEKKALAALTALFGQSVRGEFSAATVYSEAVSGGIITVSENNRVRDQVVTAASMDTLIGAEIGNVWDDGRGTVYAAAYMDRAATVAVYTALIQSNQGNIAALTGLGPARKNTFDGYARYGLAAVMAGINARYAQVVSQAGGPAAAAALNLKSAESYRLEAADIIKNIAVQVTVEGDRANRVRDAFAKVLAAEGLRTRGTSPPYTLEVSVGMSEAVFPGNDMKYCRYTVSAELVEKESGAVLFPFTIADRLGHLTYEGAQSSAFLAIEKTVAGEYPLLFREYLAALLPGKR